MTKTFLSSSDGEEFIKEIEKSGYYVIYQSLDTQRITGIPVKENDIYIVGYISEDRKSFKFLEGGYSSKAIEDIFFDPYYHIEEYYYNIDSEQIEREETSISNKFYCWKKGRYISSDIIKWDIVKVPLINTDGKIRKLTHREIARLKGIPNEYYLDTNNKSWLYRKLMLSPNVKVVELIARSIKKFMEETPVRNQQTYNGIKFEELLHQYFERQGYKLVKESRLADFDADFIIENRQKCIYIEAKFYTNNLGIENKILQICKQLSIKINKINGMFILIIGNVVSKSVKQRCEKEYGIYIWDIENLLWMFREYSDITNEFIALLNYTIENIIPVRPKEFFSVEKKKKNKTTDLSQKLLAVEPGNEHFVEYENVCTEILKYIFGNYLTLWENQITTNSGLYRIDLCCKIKYGELHEFFDTIRRFFNTKYIIFEFKNYKNPITQKEIYTTEKYLYEKALRRVAIIISREGADENALVAAKGCLRENGKLIICLSNEDMLKMIELKKTKEKPTAEYLSDRLDDMLIHLEK